MTAALDATGSARMCVRHRSGRAPLTLLAVMHGDQNGLRIPCGLMVDKIITVPRSKLGERVGRLADEDMVRLGRAIVVLFGLAGS